MKQTSIRERAVGVVLRHLQPAAIVARQLNSRYAGLPLSFFARPVRVVDAGAGPQDALKAKRLFAECWYEGVNIAELPNSTGELASYDRYYLVDLDASDLSFLPDRSYDLVVSSHTIEHLERGLAVVGRLCEKVRPGGFLYLEWPSVESEGFPIRGLGLRFDDDPSHRQTYALAEVRGLVESQGLRVQFARRRRQWLRILLSPTLVVYHTLRAGKPVLYDLWDVTGFAYSLRARRPLES
jgi:SAM-dependent methyltransferase